MSPVADYDYSLDDRLDVPAVHVVDKYLWVADVFCFDDKVFHHPCELYMTSECDVYDEQLHIFPTFLHCELKLSVHSEVVLTVLNVDRNNVSVCVAFPLAFNEYPVGCVR